LRYKGGSVAHGRATTGTGRAYLAGFCWSCEGLGRRGRATTGMGRATVSGQPHHIFFLFFRIMFGQIPTKQIKITQNKTK